MCDVSGLRSPSFESSSVLYITYTYTSSMQELVMQGMQQKLGKASCPLGMWNLIIFYSIQSI